MGEDTAWQAHVIRGAIVVVAVLAFQQIVRGYVTPAVAVTVGIGYVIVSVLVDRRSREA